MQSTSREKKKRGCIACAEITAATTHRIDATGMCWFICFHLIAKVALLQSEKPIDLAQQQNHTEVMSTTVTPASKCSVGGWRAVGGDEDDEDADDEDDDADDDEDADEEEDDEADSAVAAAIAGAGGGADASVGGK
jgi:hypothetical protein